ncbi:MAG: hypothetical protein LRY71_17695 [Bacillaceae bacterium]|nr:hypothetical protein [Bacillaceae bacterium]
MKHVKKALLGDAKIGKDFTVVSKIEWTPDDSVIGYYLSPEGLNHRINIRPFLMRSM